LMGLVCQGTPPQASARPPKTVNVASSPAAGTRAGRPLRCQIRVRRGWRRTSHSSTETRWKPSGSARAHFTARPAPARPRRLWPDPDDASGRGAVRGSESPAHGWHSTACTPRRAADAPAAATRAGAAHARRSLASRIPAALARPRRPAAPGQRPGVWAAGRARCVGQPGPPRSRSRCRHNRIRCGTVGNRRATPSTDSPAASRRTSRARCRLLRCGRRCGGGRWSKESGCRPGRRPTRVPGGWRRRR